MRFVQVRVVCARLTLRNELAGSIVRLLLLPFLPHSCHMIRKMPDLHAHSACVGHLFILSYYCYGSPVIKPDQVQCGSVVVASKRIARE
jgi:hypothetical protein